MSDRSLERLSRAEQRATEARRRLGATLDEVQEKLSPANIISETSKDLREKGLALTDQLLSSLSARPLLATVAATAIGWLLSRKPALALLIKLFFGRGATSRTAAHSIDSKRQRKPRAPSSAAAVAKEDQ